MLTRQRIERYLIKLGASPGYIGYRYLARSVCFVFEDAALLDNVKGELYPSVAEFFNVSVSNVEKGISTLIQNINWVDNDFAKQLAVCDDAACPPTGTKLIAQLYRFLIFEKPSARHAGAGLQRNLLEARRILIR